MTKTILILISFFLFHLAIAAVSPNSLITDNQRRTYFLDIAQVLQENEVQLQSTLNEVGALAGAQYEIRQSIATLNGAVDKELSNLNNVHDLNKLVIFGSSNIPLYTLVMQVLIPLPSFNRVVFRMSSKTQAIYQKLWSIIEKGLGEKYNLNSVNFLSSSRRSLKGEMMNEILGSSTDHTPADMVVFTGNPQNGDAIAEEIKSAMSKTPWPNHKLLFLKFGAGINPVLVDSSVNLEKLNNAIDASIEHFQINSGQDCISPNFTLIPEKEKMAVTEIVRNKVASLKFGTLQDLEADYSPLTFGTQKSIEDLRAFKDKYLEFLITDPAAIIDPISKRVDPHVFVVPASKYSELPLSEFYAPFAVFITYNTSEELSQMINDPRITKRTMFASLFGDNASSSFKLTMSELRRTRHIVIPNASLFSVEDGNRPFGGFSEDVSSVDKMEVIDGVFNWKRFKRPILISKELKREFVGYKPPVSPSQSQGHHVISSVDPKMTFGIEIEMNVKNNPKIIEYYRPAKFSESEWNAFDQNQRRKAALEWEAEIGKQYKVVGYLKLSKAPAEFPEKLLSESNGFYEMNGMIFQSIDEVSAFLKTVRSLIGEGYIQGHAVFNKNKFRGYAGYYKFTSDASIIQRLVSEQKRYVSSGNKMEFLPGSNFVSHSLPPPSQQTFEFVDGVENRILQGTYNGFETEEEYLIHKHVSAPVVRSSKGFAKTYEGDRVGIEGRMADWPADSPMMAGRTEEALSNLKMIESSIGATGDLSLFDEFRVIETYGRATAAKTVSEFLSLYDRYFTQEEKESIDLKLINSYFGNGGVIDTLIRSQNTHIDYGPLDASLRLLFPIRAWHLHPIFKSIESEEKRSELIDIYIHSTKKYLIGLNDLLKKGNPSTELLVQARKLLGTWAWGAGHSNYSEMLTPWNTKVKLLKQDLEYQKTKGALRCQNSLSPRF